MSKPSPTNPLYSNWMVEFRCAKCAKKLTPSQVHYKNGVCPHCGNDSESTIIAHTRHPYRLRWVKPEWHFWEVPEIEYK
jgi:DNA-directed RNA polymerase subunit RPC12/RpoP